MDRWAVTADLLPGPDRHRDRDTALAATGLDHMTLIFVLADGETLQFHLRDRPTPSLRRWCARVGLPCAV